MFLSSYVGTLLSPLKRFCPCYQYCIMSRLTLSYLAFCLDLPRLKKKRRIWRVWISMSESTQVLLPQLSCIPDCFIIPTR